MCIRDRDDQYVHTEYPDVSSRPRVIVVGEGPGGLFASLRLIEPVSYTHLDVYKRQVMFWPRVVNWLS